MFCIFYGENMRKKGELALSRMGLDATQQGLSNFTPWGSLNGKGVVYELLVLCRFLEKQGQREVD